MRRVAFALLACSACSGGATAGSAGFPAEPLTVLTSDGGKLHLELRTAPDQPPTVGLDSVELIVTEPTSGAAVDGLGIQMTPWMVNMGHGTSTVPSVQAKGGGRYVITNVSLFMAGEWQLRMQFSGALMDTSEPTFDVQ